MASWNEGEEGDNWVTYGTAFSDDETDEGRFRAMQSGRQRAVPAAYEQRILNEKGRPLRFHGAFTGGFSAGYFNTVGSKEEFKFLFLDVGFKPRSFQSSRRERQRDPKEQDFGEFGIAPRRIRMAHTFDDTHIRDTLKVAFGGQSVIPGASSIIKDLIVPWKGPLADRLLRKLGWRERLSTHTSDPPGFEDSVESSETTYPTSSHKSEQSSIPFYTKISFEAKANTFGLGYCGLNPDLAMGRRSQTDASFRHPEESHAALAQRQGSLPVGFNPCGGCPTRAGIRGQAFGVGALETDDTDVYTSDQLADYDWEIGGPNSDGDEDDADNEEAEIEAARLGRWSSTSERQKGQKSSTNQRKAFDGWTAPSQCRDTRQSIDGSKSGHIPGFVPSSANNPTEFLPGTVQIVRIPPGYMPVFNPQCVRNPSASLVQPELPVLTETHLSRSSHHLDAVSRSGILEGSSTGSIFDLVNPIDQLRMDGAAAGLPVPPRSDSVAVLFTTSISTNSTPLSTVSAVFPKTEALLKPFKVDPEKQARFEAFQVLIRRGFTPELAYTRCSGGVDLSGEDRDRELNAFSAILHAAKLQTALPTPIADSGTNDTTGSQPPPIVLARSTPLTTHLPAHKQQLVANLLSSRFRSAGCMDISKELSEKEEKAFRAKVENLETVEPRDRAVATEHYGALTRRRLTWHPDGILCKRVNVPNPYPDSTFVGCPDERRPRNPFRRRGIGRRKEGDASVEFSLFDLLDVNRGMEVDDLDEDEEDVHIGEPVVTREPEAELSLSNPQADGSAGEPTRDQSKPLPRRVVNIPNSRGAALFACLFEAAEAANSQMPESKLSDTPQNTTSSGQESTSPGPRRIGPSLPVQADGSDLVDDVPDGRPSMDLFKSIFASDEELSSSESDDQEQTSITEQLPNKPPSQLSPATNNRAIADNSWIPESDRASFFARLFQPTGDMGAPLSDLSRITSRSLRQDCNQEGKSNSDELSHEPDPTFLHGPALPPDFDNHPTSSVAAPISTDETTSILHPVSDKSHSERLQWTDAKLISSSERKRKHKLKRTKQPKHHRKHKHPNSRSRKKEASSQKSGSSSTTDSSD
ncbi:G patch domain-containing protein 1 [Paragonimus westermani]|uniref:G patch domain-containing protein 1 n=1 Tax=Paragonimus westermani TaxID=34504 RepID=A0A5J4P280_9TREM|nr:G patch domain-containing protein 1 [Paragonimus westermani]